MITELVNSIFITYLASEYSLSNKSGTLSRPELFLQQRSRVGTVGAAVLTINVLDSITGIGGLVHLALNRFLRLPKVALAAGAYVVALYYDCQWTLVRRKCNPLRFRHEFCPRVMRAFVRILPIYPILAVLLSFIFLFVITAFEFLQLSTEILNWPIYYGTLYGPFSYIYWTVKSKVLLEFQNTIPISINPSLQLGSS